MATLAIAAAGAMAGGAALGTGVVFAGLTGTQIGWMAGGLIGSAFGSSGESMGHQEGPRLGDLSVTSSTEGNGVPILWGSDRIAGNIIWADEIQEHKSTESVGGGGKGGPKGGGGSVTTYTYTATFAVSFGMFEGGKLRRVWANKKLVYDATGISEMTLKKGVAISYYDGTQTEPDSDIEAVVGEGNCPAYKGHTMVVIRDLDIEDFGRRIPSIEAEIATEATEEYTVKYYGTDQHIIDNCSDGSHITGTSSSIIYSKKHRTFVLGYSRPYDSAKAPLVKFNARSLETSFFDTDFGNYTLSRIVGVSSKGKEFGTNDYMAVGGNTEILRVINVGTGDTVTTGTSTSIGGGAYAVNAESSNYFWRIAGDVNNPSICEHAKLEESFPEAVRKSFPYFVFWGTVFDFYQIDALFADWTTDKLYWVVYEVGTKNPVLMEVDTHSGNDLVYTGVSHAIQLDPDYKYKGKLFEIGAAYSNHDWFSINGASIEAIYDVVADKYWVVVNNQTFSPVKTYLCRLDVKTGYIDYIINLRDLGMVTYSASNLNIGIAMDQDSGLLTVQSSGQLLLVYTRQLFYRVMNVGQNCGYNYPYVDRNMFIGACTVSETSHGVSSPTPAAAYFRTTREGVSGPPDGIEVAPVLEDICQRAGIPANHIDTSLVTEKITGFTHTRVAKARSDLEILMTACLLDAAVIDSKLTFVPRNITPVKDIPWEDIGAKEGLESEESPFKITYPKEIDLPQMTTVQFKSVNNNYDIGVGHGYWAKGNSQKDVTMQMPLVLTNARGNRLANIFHNQLIDRRDVSFVVDDSYIDLVPTDVVRVQLEDRWVKLRIQNIDHGVNGLLKIEGAVLNDTHFEAFDEVSGGADFTETIPVAYPPDGYVLDIPLLMDTHGDHPGPYLTAYNEYQGFSSVSWYVSSDDTTYLAVEGQPMEPIGGVVETVPVTVDFTGWDDTNVLTVVLNDETEALSSLSDSEVLAGGNAFIWGANGRYEIAQFGTATLVSAGTYELSHLLRGRRGTDIHIDGHAANDQFILLDGSSSFVRHMLQVSDIGTTRFYKPVQTGDYVTDTEAVQHTVDDTALQPYTPIDVAVTEQSLPVNDATIAWTARRRLGGSLGGIGGYADGVGADPDVSEYKVRIYEDDQVTLAREVDVASSPYVYSEADQITDFGSVPQEFYVQVAPISSLVSSVDRWTDLVHYARPTIPTLSNQTATPAGSDNELDMSVELTF